MGALGQWIPQVLSSAVKIGLGGDQGPLGLRVLRHTEGQGGGSGDFGSTQLLPLGG